MVQVRVIEGLLEGEKVENEYGGTYYSFKGIPYAHPPVGDLRFKAPQPLQPWTGVRNATKFGPICYQYDLLNPNPDNMSEDCLYLNVYTPYVTPDQRLSVMVFIHGGAFISESGNDDIYGPEFLVRHGIILVTLNYRLGAFGFLCLHSPDVPGNAGMKDQNAALRWVKKNINNFGGDPDNITIFGESAGGASIAYHLISPMSRGLFRRAIAQSGASACWWSQDFESRDKALLLAKKLGCFTEDNTELYEFFKKQPANLLINLNLHIWKAQKQYELHFAIADEKDFGQERFFYGDLMHVLRNGVHEGVEIMTGYTKDEGLLALVYEHSFEKIMTEVKYFNEFLVPQWIKTHRIIADQLEVGRKMRQFYFRGGGGVTEDGVMKFLSMDFFLYGIILSAKVYSQKNKVFVYKFTCVTNRNIFGHAMGLTEFIKDKSVVFHGDDIAYLFPTKRLTGKVDMQSESFKLINATTKLWTNFAKYGNPTPKGNDLALDWRPYTLENQEYLDLGNNLVMDRAPEKEEYEFWESIFREYLPQYTF